jgi:hypothetical protein
MCLNTHLSITFPITLIKDRGLLKKLESISIRGSLLDWVQNYLSGRKQRVVINNASSDWGFNKTGVPQESILPNIARYDPNFLTLIQCLTKLICNINKLMNSRITFRKSRVVVCLCRLFNLSFRTGIFPTNWKCANVTLIFKIDSPSNDKNYNIPILLTPT